MNRMGLFTMDRAGIPMDARQRINELFMQVEIGEADAAVLKKELDRWGLFAEYEDRFLSLFKRK
jgi:hypothetical protein